MFLTRVLLSGLFLFPFAPTPFQEKSETQRKAEGEPSLEETLTWLKEKLEASLSSSRVVGRGAVSNDTFEAKPFSSCEVGWQSTFSATTSVSGVGIGPQGKRSSGNLGSIDPTRTKITTTPSVTYLFLFIRKDANGFLEEDFETRLGREVKLSAARSGLLIFQFRQPVEGVVPRIAKAFEHASELCAMKREPF